MGNAERLIGRVIAVITALFCDLRGFTGFTESADAEDVMALLRDYHAAIGEIVIKYNGTLERYAGDGVMVVFNDPVPVENPDRHVFNHAPTQRADALIGHGILLSEPRLLTPRSSDRTTRPVIAPTSVPAATLRAALYRASGFVH
jgi:class 3 adenylate cyclase